MNMLIIIQPIETCEKRNYPHLFLTMPRVLLRKRLIDCPTRPQDEAIYILTTMSVCQAIIEAALAQVLTMTTRLSKCKRSLTLLHFVNLA